MSPSNLANLARQVAAGDAAARHAFERQIVPLLETVVRRWLDQQRRERLGVSSGDRTAAGEIDSAAALTERVERIASAVCARLVHQVTPATRTDLRPGDETLIAGQLLETIVGSALPTRG